ncbi:MAG: hypothetical protein BRC40_09515 [Cyanobacteria bacterium QH_8_48_120]|nr:MAG: hypothetical protein BRC34_14695 [Cyanobacteria bacterium QH_1_48_107]PSO72804.1 MAG: hypothetical protein BRC40_09515 [Cyanobacteria bacterium QH_8_48_120]
MSNLKITDLDFLETAFPEEREIEGGEMKLSIHINDMNLEKLFKEIGNVTKKSTDKTTVMTASSKGKGNATYASSSSKGGSASALAYSS